MNDKNVRKRKDSFGEMTVAKLSTVTASSGTRVANKKEIGSFNEFNAGDQNAIDDARESSNLSESIRMCPTSYHFAIVLTLGLLRSRLDVELGIANLRLLGLIFYLHIQDIRAYHLPSSGEEDPADGMAGVRPKAKAKAKSNKRNATKQKALKGDDVADDTTVAGAEKDKRRRVDKEAKARLDSLKLQTDMVHMQQKWTCRIKTINIEVTTSIKASEEFSFLEGFLG